MNKPQRAVGRKPGKPKPGQIWRGYMQGVGGNCTFVLLSCDNGVWTLAQFYEYGRRNVMGASMRYFEEHDFKAFGLRLVGDVRGSRARGRKRG